MGDNILSLQVISCADLFVPDPSFSLCVSHPNFTQTHCIVKPLKMECGCPSGGGSKKKKGHMFVTLKVPSLMGAPPMEYTEEEVDD